MSSPPAKRDVVQFALEGKSRTAVVLDVDLDAETAIVAYGTRTARELVCVMVPAPSPSATLLGLHSTTYFYAQSIRYVAFQQLSRPRGRCSPGLFIELRRLLEGYARSLVRPQETRAPAQAEQIPGGRL